MNRIVCLKRHGRSIRRRCSSSGVGRPPSAVLARWTLSLAVWLACLCGSLGCHASVRNDAGDVVAWVDDCRIDAATWRQAVRRARAELTVSAGPFSLPTTGRQMHARFILDDLIDHRLLLRAAERAHVLVAPADVEAAIKRLGAGWPTAQLAAILASLSVSPDKFAVAMYERLMVQKYVRDFVLARLDIADVQVDHYLAAHPAELKWPERIRLAQIIVPTLEEAQRLARAIREGHDFAEVARSASQAPEAVRGGDLGTIERGVLPEAFERICFTLPPRMVSPPVQDPYGYHLFWIGEHLMPADKPPLRSRAEARVALWRGAASRAQAQAVAALRRDATIRIEETLVAAETF